MREQGYNMSRRATTVRNIETATLNILLEDFLRHIVDYRNYAETTLRAYRTDCGQFIKFLEDHQRPLSPEQVGTRDVRLFLSSLNNLSPSSVRRKLYAISSFFEYLRQSEILTTNPAAPIDPPKLKRKLPHVPSRDQCQQLLRACESARERLVVGLLYLAGLRRSEALGLDMSDVGVDVSAITVKGKGGHERMMPVSSRLRQILADYLQARDCDGPSLVANAVGNRMGTTSFYRLFDRVLERAELTDTGITPHTLRHAFASQLVRAGVDIATISELLGHANIATTSIYLHTTPESKMNAVECLCQDEVPGGDGPLGGQPRFHDGTGQVTTDHIGAERNDLRVVALPGQPRRVEVGDRCRKDSRHFIGGDGHSEARPAY